MSLILGLVVGRIKIVASASQAGIHDGKVLIRQCEVYDQFGLVVVEQSLELLNIVSINLCCLDVSLISLCLDGLYQLITFLLPAAGNHELCEDVRILDNLECRYCGHATGTNH